MTLLGAGCAVTQEQVSPKIAEPIGEIFTERPIAQNQGFGIIPPAPAARLRPGVSGSVRIAAEMPSLPNSVTVLRVKTGLPNDTQLRNIAAAFNLPGGIIGANPVSRMLKLEWRDADQVMWSYSGAERKIDFIDETRPLKTLTVFSWPEKTALTEDALAFLSAYGINRRRFGDPYILPDWSAWYAGQSAQGRCMDLAALNRIRTLSATPLLTEEDLPALPESLKTACLKPEFPSRVVVKFNATQDGQGIYNANGAPYYGAILIVDATNGAVVSGSFLAHVDPDRSDYPAITSEEAAKAMASGGLGGTPAGDVVIDDIAFEWLRIEDEKNAAAVYLYPALIGQGTITFRDKKTASYRIVVPLVK